MFKKELAAKLKEIFGIRKVTFDAPSESFEQDTLFIQINSARSKPAQGTVSAKVEGQCVIFSKHESNTFGFFSKMIEQANPQSKKNLFFYNVDVEIPNSPARLINISERRVDFIYLYKAQYDPEQGSLTSLELEYNYNE